LIDRRGENRLLLLRTDSFRRGVGAMAQAGRRKRNKEKKTSQESAKDKKPAQK
jgi:hypothetical protein